jgi:hypothetical protein
MAPLSDTVSVKMTQLVLYPFNYEPNVKNFSYYLRPCYKLQVYSVRNRLIPTQTDTIFKFYKKNSELFIYKAYERELFIAGNIYDSRIVLRNGIKVGISRRDFQKCFTDLPVNNGDTIRLTAGRAINSMYFIFRNNILKVIRIDNHFN